MDNKKFINPLHMLQILKLNPEWIDWEPETIWRDIDNLYDEQKQGEPKFPRIFKDIIMALKLCVNNELPWNQWNAFNQVVLAFNNVVPSFSFLIKPSLAQAAFAVFVMNKIKSVDFNEEVCNYIACIAKHDGIIAMPSILSFCQSYLDKMNPGLIKLKEAVSTAIAGKTIDPSYKSSNIEAIKVQLAKLAAVEEYVNSKTDTKLEKLSFFETTDCLNYVEENGYRLNKGDANEMSKYILLDDKDFAIKCFRDGIILRKHNINAKLMDDKTISDLIFKLEHKTPRQIGAIYKRLYKKINEKTPNKFINKILGVRRAMRTFFSDIFRSISNRLTY